MLCSGWSSIGEISMSGARFFFSSRVSGWGYKFGPVRLCVCLLALSWLNRLTYGPKIWWKDISSLSLRWVRRSRSKAKVAKLENMIFGISYRVTGINSLCRDTCHVMSRWTSWRLDVMSLRMRQRSDVSIFLLFWVWKRSWHLPRDINRFTIDFVIFIHQHVFSWILNYTYHEKFMDKILMSNKKCCYSRYLVKVTRYICC